MDPLCEKYYSISPYAYCGNNPMRYIDPTDMDKGDINDPYDLPEVVVTPPDFPDRDFGDYYTDQEFWDDRDRMEEDYYGWYDIANSFGGMAGLEFSVTANLKQNELFWRDAKGNYRSTNVLKQGTNGKYVKGVQGIRNSYTIASKAAQGAKVLGHSLAFAGIAIHAIDMSINGINVSNSMDMAMIGVGFIPGVGWMISGTYFIADMVTIMTTGESISKHTQNWVESW